MSNPISFIPAPTRVRGRRRQFSPPGPTALTLVAASYQSGAGTVTLVFDRAINADGMDGSAINLNDPVVTGSLFEGSGAAELVDPVTARITLTPIDGASGAGVRLSAAAGNGIVAADDGAAWAGVTDLVLPFGA